MTRVAQSASLSIAIGISQSSCLPDGPTILSATVQESSLTIVFSKPVNVSDLACSVRDNDNGSLLASIAGFNGSGTDTIVVQLDRTVPENVNAFMDISGEISDFDGNQYPGTCGDRFILTVLAHPLRIMEAFVVENYLYLSFNKPADASQVSDMYLLFNNTYSDPPEYSSGSGTTAITYALKYWVWYGMGVGPLTCTVDGNYVSISVRNDTPYIE